MDHLGLRGLKSSAEFLEAIFESSDDAIIAATAEGIILIWNKGAEKLYGYTEQEVLGQHISIIAPEGHKKDIELVIQKVIHDSYLHHYRTVRRHKDGHLISVSVSASPVKNHKGEIIAVSAITRDLTDQDAA